MNTRKNHHSTRQRGFVLIEALIALVLISIGLVAVAKLQVLSMSGSGEAKARSEAMALSQKKLEELRNFVIRTQYTTDPMMTDSADLTGTNATFHIAWTIASLGNPEQKLIQMATTWTDRNGGQTLNLDSLIAWDDPGSQGKLQSPPNTNLISPTGDAKRGTGQTVDPSGMTHNGDGSYTDSQTHITYLLDANNHVLLYLKPKGAVEQFFTTISGRIYFDQGETVPPSANVRVRLSSEGECVYDSSTSTVNDNGVVAGGSNGFKFFNYTCYVGPGWYGNVGVIVDDSVSGPAGDPTICVGDPTYNGGNSDNTLVSPNSTPSGTRTYRGFRGSPGAYMSTGMGSSTHYGTTAGLSGSTAYSGQIAGLPVPSGYHPFYSTINNNDANNYFDQNFLVTHINGQLTDQKCATKMSGGAFTRNAGKYFCIDPDDEATPSHLCPAIWPNLENQVGSGNGVILTVVPAGTGTGTVTSAPSGINCGSVCLASFTSGASVTLSASPIGGSTFAGWSGGGCSGTGSCVVTMSAATSVTATFTAAVTNYTLTVAASGSGAVNSTPSGISNCSATSGTCSAPYASGTQVTLSAAPGNGWSFTGWSGGGCTGTGTCTVTLVADTSVTATFAAAPAYSVTVTLGGAGTGLVTSSIGGISCNPACTSTALALNDSVTLTATPSGGSSFSGWSGSGCSGTGTCTVSVAGPMSVTATFAPPVTMYALTVSKAGAGSGTVTGSPGAISCGGNCSASYASGTTVTLTAAATSGGFTGWTGACSGTSTTCTVTMDAAKSVIATFGSCNTPIAGSAFDKNGTVTVSPSAAGSCAMQGGNSAGYNCTITAASGTGLTLTNARTTGQTYSYTRQTVANCSSQAINFPTGP